MGEIDDCWLTSIEVTLSRVATIRDSLEFLSPVQFPEAARILQIPESSSRIERSTPCVPLGPVGLSAE